MPKMVHFGEFLEIWSVRSKSVTRRVTFNRTKIGGKCQNSNVTFWVIFKQYAWIHVPKCIWSYRKVHFVSNYRSSCQNIGKGECEKTIGINTNPLIENGPMGDIIIEEPKIPLQFSTTAMVTVSYECRYTLF